ncbi:hypothetical protein [Marispirochaeta sp.]|uniref:hypothetical protein n=1 Tax=Marispirochaeta sp. TaxID=2038653 RepID=UPI0029C989F9|nr:hypothetical protein [Marispirochaeta sp.]
MVKGLDLFREHFRATKDLDIVLCIESFDSDFAGRFWEFVVAGEYSNRQKSSGKKLFYRFHSPQKDEYPFMLELFSRVPDFLQIESISTQLTPIPVEEDISSLSAILLDSVYYNFIHQNKKIIEDLPLIGPEILIPLKARAWMDLTNRKESGQKIDSRDIRKHRNDIFRLFPLLPGNLSISFPEEIKKDLKQFTDRIVSDSGINLKTLGIRTQSLNGVISRLKELYRI